MSTTAATPAGISTICQLCRKSGVCNRVLPSPNSSTSLSASCMRRRKWSTRVTDRKGNCWSMKCWTTRAGAGKASAGAALPYQRPQPAGGGARDFAPARQQRIYSPVCLRAGTCPRGLAVRDQHDPRLHHPRDAMRAIRAYSLLGVFKPRAGAGGASRRRDRKISSPKTSSKSKRISSRRKTNALPPSGSRAMPVSHIRTKRDGCCIVRWRSTWLTALPASPR